MKRIAAACFLLLLPSIVLGEDSLPDPLTITQGRISGEKLPSGIWVYRGLPFAAPPTGARRWKPPAPPLPWEGVRKAGAFGPVCPQPTSPILGEMKIGERSEDCLFLNVWTPARSSSERLPVMVWIHGGGFSIGAGSYGLYDGERLARRGVVTVTINYRLGPFGFFAHPLLSKESGTDSSGNYGLLDQIAALEWVKQNISAFGGDADCVTIFGESAGGGSVYYLLVSPKAKGLFHRAVIESWPALSPTRRLRRKIGRLDPMESIGSRVAETLGCAEAEDPLAAMRAKTVEEILTGSQAASGAFVKGVKFWPIVDGTVLPEEPARLFRRGAFHRVPLLAGSNGDEGTIYLKQIPVRTPGAYAVFLRACFPGFGPEAMRHFPLERDEYGAALNRILTWGFQGGPVRALVRCWGQGKEKAFLYHFARAAPAAQWKGLGAFHGAEVAYVFGNLDRPPRLGYDRVDHRLSDTLMAYWVNFARTGDPNGKGLAAWPAHDRKTDRCLVIGDKAQARSGLEGPACDFIARVLDRRWK